MFDLPIVCWLIVIGCYFFSGYCIKYLNKGSDEKIPLWWCAIQLFACLLGSLLLSQLIYGWYLRRDDLGETLIEEITYINIMLPLSIASISGMAIEMVKQNKKSPY